MPEETIMRMTIQPGIPTELAPEMDRSNEPPLAGC